MLGIALNIDESEELDIHESAFKKMRNLLFLKITNKEWYMRREWHLPEGLDYFPPKLRLLCWDNYSGRCLPTKFVPKNLVKIQMQGSKLEKLWDGAHVSSFSISIKKIIIYIYMPFFFFFLNTYIYMLYTCFLE